MRTASFLSALAGGLLLSGAALADGHTRPSVQPNFYEGAPLWSGFYFGGSAGFGAGDTSGRPQFGEGFSFNFGPLDEDDVASLFNTDYELSGAVYGAHIGYNTQRGHAVFGLEAGIYASDIDGSTRCVFTIATCSREVDWYGTLVARLGYAVDRVMFYGLGGLAYGKVSTAVDLGGDALKGDDRHTGWTAGLGLEYAMTDRFFVRVEYAHVDLGEKTTRLGGDFDGVDALRSDIDVSFDTIKIGASFKLGDRRAYQPLK